MGNKVTISVCGKDYALQTSESPEYMKQLASRLDQKIREMMDSNESISLTSAAVLVGLTLMDDSIRTNSDIGNIRGEIRNYVEEAGKARAEAEQLKKELTMKSMELEKLKAEMGLQQLRRELGDIK